MDTSFRNHRNPLSTDYKYLSNLFRPSLVVPVTCSTIWAIRPHAPNHVCGIDLRTMIMHIFTQSLRTSLCFPCCHCRLAFFASTYSFPLARFRGWTVVP